MAEAEEAMNTAAAMRAVDREMDEAVEELSRPLLYAVPKVEGAEKMPLDRRPRDKKFIAFNHKAIELAEREIAERNKALKARQADRAALRKQLADEDAVDKADVTERNRADKNIIAGARSALKTME